MKTVKLTNEEIKYIKTLLLRDYYRTEENEEIPEKLNDLIIDKLES